MFGAQALALAWSALLAASVPYGVFPSSLVFGVALFAGGPVPCLCSSCFHGLVLGMIFSAPRLSAAGGRLLLRSGSCRPPEVSFGLRSFWCVRFFRVLGCFLRFWPHLLACRSLLVFLPRSGGINLICVWWVKLWHGVRYSLRAFPMC